MLRRLLKNLPLFKELRELRNTTSELRGLVATLQQASTHQYSDALLRTSRYNDEKRLNQFESQVFSQSGEDGIIAEIFRRVGVTNRIFAEVGVGNGLENNTALLLAQDWSGSWIDGDSASAANIRSVFGEQISSKQLKFLESFVTAENIVDLFQRLAVPIEADFVSLDIDCNTYWIWQALSAYRPRVIAVEYNATWPPSVLWKAAYDPSAIWDGSMHFGASLKAFEALGASLGYTLVGCDLGGANAFFVRKDLENGLFAAPFTSENHYEPARYWLARRNGHPRAFGKVSKSN